MKFISTPLDKEMTGKFYTLMEANSGNKVEDDYKEIAKKNLNYLIAEFSNLDENADFDSRKNLSNILLELGKNMRRFGLQFPLEVQKYDELIAYFYLKAADVILGDSFNGIKFSFDDENEFKMQLMTVIQLIASIEINNENALKHVGIAEKVKLFLRAYINFITSKEIKGERIYPDELAKAIAEKNKRGNDFRGDLIRYSDSSYFCSIDPESFKLLFNRIKEIKTTKQRTQFIFYCNSEVGHVIELDVCFNQEEQRFEILCLESSDLVQQWILLKKLCDGFTKENLIYKIIACQVNIQKDTFLCPLYAYAFADETSQISFGSLNKPELFISQPDQFSSPEGARNMKSLPSEHVHWIPIAVLPLKILLMGQSRVEIEENLKKKYGDDAVANKILQSFMTQFNFDKAQYPVYRRKQLAKKIIFLENPTLIEKELKEIKDKIAAKLGSLEVTDGQIIRNAAANPKNITLFSLINKEKPMVMNSQDTNPKSLKTPLHWAIEKGFTFYAIKLIKAGADMTLKNAQGKTPVDCYKESTDIVLKNNEKLAKLMG